jgi:HEAT repeats
MLANEAEFEVLLTRYEDDPGICSKILRTHSLTDPKIFVGYAQNAILKHPVSRALKFITGLALSAGMMDTLLDLYGTSRPQCMTLAQKLMTCDPRFDVTFLEFLQRRHPGEAEENVFHVGLDILDRISQGDRLVPGVLKVLKHSNPKVRSKAALFIGSRTQNIAWAASRAQEYDARVRANIIESLYGINSDFVHQIFRNNVADENNRVAGNAILGLYMLGDTAAIPLIHELARHPDSRFRNTCAWVMGRTGDPRFAQSFSELMNDPDELVRAQAFKGLGEVRKALRNSAKRPELRASIVKVLPDEISTAIVTVHDNSGQAAHGIPATSFILKSGSPAKPARHFSVDEYDCRSSLNAAFIFCGPDQEHEAAADARFVQAVQACQNLRRSKDRWSVVRISPKLKKLRPNNGVSDASRRPRHRWAILQVDIDPEFAVPGAQIPEPLTYEYSGTQPRIDAMLREPAVLLSPDPVDEAAGVILSSLLRVDIASGKPHLFFFGAGPHTQLLDAVQAKGEDAGAVVHVFAQSEAWRATQVKDFALQTGGVYRTVDHSTILGDVCFETYSSLLHHYRIGWKDGSAEGVELDIHCDSGRASAVHDMAVLDVPDTLRA